MKKFKGVEIIVSSIALILIIALSAVLGVLKNLEILKTNASTFKIILTTLMLGIGLYLTIFAIIRKGGYEFSVGGILLTIGVSLFMSVLNAKPVINVIITVALFLILFISLFLLKAKSLTFVTSDKEEGYTPYMETLKKQKQLEEERAEELPEIKSFKD